LHGLLQACVVAVSELRSDGFGAEPQYQCIVAEALVDGQPSTIFLLILHTFPVQFTVLFIGRQEGHPMCKNSTHSPCIIFRERPWDTAEDSCWL